MPAMNRPSILCAALWPELPLPAHAAADAGAAPDVAHEFDRVRVTGTRTERTERTERAVSAVAATVDVIDRERLDNELVHHLRALLRDEPGLSATRSATRFGIGGSRIRGLDGNRVRIQTAPGAKFNVGVFKLADRRHDEWSAITGTLGSTSTVVDRFSNPGRTVSASLAVSW